MLHPKKYTNSVPLYKVATEKGQSSDSPITQSALPNICLNNNNKPDNFSVIDNKSQNSSDNYQQVKKVKLASRDNCKTARENKLIAASLTEQSVLTNNSPLHESAKANDKLSTIVSSNLFHQSYLLITIGNQRISQYSMTKATILLIFMT